MRCADVEGKSDTIGLCVKLQERGVAKRVLREISGTGRWTRDNGTLSPRDCARDTNGEQMRSLNKKGRRTRITELVVWAEHVEFG